MVNVRDSLWSRSCTWVAAAWAVLILLTACGTPATPPTPPATVGGTSSDTPAESSAPAGGSVSEVPTGSAPPGRRTEAPPPVPVPRSSEAELGEGEGIRPPNSSMAELDRHSLSVKTYGAEDPSRCGLEAPKSSSPPSTVQVFFGCTPKSGPVVGAVPARLISVPSGTSPERAALQALLAGPTAQERRAGYVSNFGDASRGVGMEVEIRNDGMAVVNFDQAIQEKANAFVSRLDSLQIVATMAQFPGVERVLILIEGEPLCKALGEC